MSADPAVREPQLAQLGICTDDIAATVRLYTEAFGFADSGSHIFWGRYLGNIQELGDDATCSLQWMVGRQDRIQLELFNHVEPPQRPQADDWRPSDLGWVRWGIAVPDLDDALARMERLGVRPETAPIEQDGLRRVAFRDPGSRIFVELMEEGPGFPGGIRPRQNTLMPAIAYAAVSVADLGAAREFYVGVLGLREEPDVVLHTAAAEALWGLEGASAERLVLRAGTSYVELVRYQDPAPRPRPEGHRLSDQGFMNGGFLATDRQQFEEIVARAAAAGITPNNEVADREYAEAYLVDGEGTLSELMLVPREMEEEYGFVARARFPPPAPWPNPRVAAARR
jgi:catechol 2,3-dioxygenase-like lactoylglutathione lyase family enzyme